MDIAAALGGFTVSLLLAAPVPVALELAEMEVVNRRANESDGAIHLDAAPGVGLAWVKGVDLNDGCLALEVKGSNEIGQSFVGIAFRALNADVYDAVYVRPFVFQSDDPARAAHALQYMSVPEFEWPALRRKHPGVYERPIGSRPHPDDWVHLQVRFKAGRLRVTVNHAPQPQLDVPLLTEQSAGRVALWTGNNSKGSFRNLVRCE